MTFLGMDPEAISRLALQLRQQADEVTQVVNAVDGLISHASTVWPGPDCDAFSDHWYSTLRPAMTVVASETGQRAQWLSGQADQQSMASGGSETSAPPSSSTSPGPGSLSGAAGAVDSVREVADRTGVIRSLEGIAADLGDVGGVPWSHPAFKNIHGALGIFGLVADGADVIDGYATGDAGKLTTGGIGMASVFVPPPIKIAVAAGTLYGSTVLPTDQAGYDGTYELAMRRQFGADWTPETSTPAQSEWGVRRYEGGMGFLNSISDGMEYKKEEAGKFFSNVGNGISSWFGGGR